MDIEDVLKSVNEYILSDVPSDTIKTPVEIYEDWRAKTGIHVHDSLLALTILETINQQKNYNREILQQLKEF